MDHREKVKVDRVACPWLIKKFVDKDAEFVFVPGEVMAEAKRLDAIPYDQRRWLGRTARNARSRLPEKVQADQRPRAGVAWAIVNGADTDNTLYNHRRSGLEAVAEGFRILVSRTTTNTCG